jgi:hypothetical protein
LLGPTVGVSAVLAICGLALWGAAVWLSWGGECPGAASGGKGLGKSVAVWPPAAECVDQHGNSFWHQALPWATWVVAILVAAAALILLMGLVVAIRDLLRPAPAVSAAPLSLLETSHAQQGLPQGRAGVRDEGEAAEPDPSAIAA